MNTTIHRLEQSQKPDRLPEGALDEYYITAYLDKPQNKSEAYRSAWADYLKDNPGHEHLLPNMSYARTYANAIHTRLSETINKRLITLAEDDKALGRAILRELAINGTSESVKAQCATTMSKGLFPDHIITKDLSLTEIEAELAQIEEQERQELH